MEKQQENQPQQDKLEMEREAQLLELATEAGTYQKAILILELLTDCLGLKRNCGFVDVSNRMREVGEAFNKLHQELSPDVPLGTSEQTE